MIEDNIFTKLGTIREDLDRIEVSAERRPALDALIAAQTMCAAVETEFKAAESALAAAVRKRDAIAAEVPRSTFMDEHRASVAAYSAGRR